MTDTERSNIARSTKKFGLTSSQQKRVRQLISTCGSSNILYIVDWRRIIIFDAAHSASATVKTGWRFSCTGDDKRSDGGMDVAVTA